MAGPTNNGIGSLNDRNEGFGHDDGTSIFLDDADWDTLGTTPSQATESLATRVARTRVARQSISPNLNDDDAWDGTNTTSGSNTALAVSSGNANRDVDATYADYAAPDADMRITVGLNDRSSGFGHTAATDADLDDA
jgi:hypothetical protein